jgi:uncharacterized membrane protein
MKQLLTTVLLLSCILIPVTSQAQEVTEINLDDPIYDSSEFGVPQYQQTQEYYRAKVTKILDVGVTEFAQSPYQKVEIQFTNGDLKGDTEVVEHGNSYVIQSEQLVKLGQQVVVNKVITSDSVTFFITETYRLTAVLWILGFFFLLTVIFAGKRGLTSLIGLAISILVIVYYIVPQVVEGANPMLVALVGSLGIMCVTLYLAHGFNKRTTIALLGSLATLVLTVFLAQIFVESAALFGMGSEEAFFLKYDLAELNLRGLLLGGIIIGVLGVLDDITTAQTAAIYEIKRANPKLDFKELYERGINVGREHITSLVNTLAMAYVGSSLPLLLLIYLNLNANLWVIANSELVVEEIMRTLVGSSSLVLAVPITTLLAAWYFGKQDVLLELSKGHHHHHH